VAWAVANNPAPSRFTFSCVVPADGAVGRLIGFQQFDLVLKVALVVIFSQIQPLYRIRGLA
jgi:hypothetical protein